MVEIKIAKDRAEIVPYNYPHFPVHFGKDWISYYPDRTAVSHWHPDVEFIVMLQGKLLYSVDGKDYLLEEGHGIFVNANRLHYGHSFKGSDCQFLCFLFHPSLLYTAENRKELYIDAVCENTALTCLLLSPANHWQAEIIFRLKQIYGIYQEEAPGFELSVLSHFYSIWLSLFRNVLNRTDKTESAADKRLPTLHAMIGYIQQHYSEKIALSEIAAAGNVCRSSCCDIFSYFLQATPIQFLTNYRLEKSIEFLNHTNFSITEIALLCGFNSASYFTEIFHRKMGCTPSQYNTKFRNNQ